jgi:hypothetical protein
MGERQESRTNPEPWTSTDNIEVTLTTHGLNGRLDTAMRVARRCPEFSEVVSLTEKTCSCRRSLDELGALLVEEYQAIQSFVVAGSRVLRDVDYLALLAGMSGFMERFEAPENNGARLVIPLLQACPAKLEGRSPNVMVAMWLWYCDYDGYRDAVTRLVAERAKAWQRGMTGTAPVTRRQARVI